MNNWDVLVYMYVYHRLSWQCHIYKTMFLFI